MRLERAGRKRRGKKGKERNGGGGNDFDSRPGKKERASGVGTESSSA